MPASLARCPGPFAPPPTNRLFAPIEGLANPSRRTVRRRILNQWGGRIRSRSTPLFCPGPPVSAKVCDPPPVGCARFQRSMPAGPDKRHISKLAMCKRRLVVASSGSRFTPLPQSLPLSSAAKAGLVLPPRLLGPRSMSTANRPPSLWPATGPRVAAGYRNPRTR